MLVWHRLSSYTQNDVFRAARQGDEALVRRALDRKPVFRQVRDGDGATLLHVATKWFQPAVVEFLLGRGADPDARTPRDETPLMLALARTLGGGDWPINALVDPAVRRHIVRLLVSRGAQVNVAGHIRSPLHEAILLRDAELVKIFVEHRADPNRWDRGGCNPLHDAAALLETEVVEMLLSAGADPNSVDRFGNTPLAACPSATTIRMLAAQEESFDRGATLANTLSIMCALLAAGADINKPQSQGWTILRFAANQNHVELVAECLRAGADIQARGEDGKPILVVLGERARAHRPSEHDVLPIAGCLLSAGADPTATDREGNSAISIARAAGLGELEALFARHCA